MVSNPGCYPTAASLALQPVIAAQVVDLSACSILNHRYVPEVLMNAGLQDHQLSFTAQLIPIDRGILEAIYFRAPGLSGTQALLRAGRRERSGRRAGEECGLAGAEA